MSYEQAQFWFKFGVTFVILVPVLVLVIKIWQKDVDLVRFFNIPKALEESANKASSWIPEREANAIYQGDKLVGKVENPVINEVEKTIHFSEINESNSLDLANEFQFRKWNLQLQTAETTINLSVSEPQKGRVVRGATCKIIGTR